MCTAVLGWDAPGPGGGGGGGGQEPINEWRDITFNSRDQLEQYNNLITVFWR